MFPPQSMISHLSAVSMGQKKADIVLKNCRLVNVYTKEIIPNTQIAIAKDRIAYVGQDASGSAGPNTAVIDLEGKFVSPSFADPHIHIDQFVMPSEFVRYCLLCGTTSLFSDPIDIVSTCGFAGFKEFLRASEKLPVRIFTVVPGGLPVDPKFSKTKNLTLAQQKAAIKIPGVVGLGEVFSWTKVTSGHHQTMQSIWQMLQNNCIINGHTAGASDKKLNSYICAGITSCHEPIDYDQTMERLRLGMWVMIREGSIRRDLKNILPGILLHKPYLDRLMFCSDGLDPQDITKYGHIDHCIREAVDIGMDPVDAICAASKHCFDYYNMGRDLGGIGPGKLADLVIFNDISNLKPSKVFVGGKLVASNGSVVSSIPAPTVPKWLKKTVKIHVGPKNFEVKSNKHQVTANIIEMDSEIITRHTAAELNTKNGNVVPSFDKDIWKVAAMSRKGDGKHTTGFLSKFGPDIGAFASSWSFHENDIIVIGSNEKDMAFAVQYLAKKQGGMVVVKDCKVLAFLQLRVGGIISEKKFEDVLEEFASINSTLTDRGCRFSRPHLVPLFLPFLALPSLRILAGGIVDVKKHVKIPPLANF